MKLKKRALDQEKELDRKYAQDAIDYQDDLELKRINFLNSIKRFDSKPSSISELVKRQDQASRRNLSTDRIYQTLPREFQLTERPREGKRIMMKVEDEHQTFK